MPDNHKTTIYIQSTCGPIFVAHELEELAETWREREFDELFDILDKDGRRWVFPCALISAMSSTDTYDPEDFYEPEPVQ